MSVKSDQPATYIPSNSLLFRAIVWAVEEKSDSADRFLATVLSDQETPEYTDNAFEMALDRALAQISHAR